MQQAQQFQRYGTPPVTMPWQQAGPSLHGQQVPDDSIETLNSDIANLIARTKSDFAQNPYDGTIQTRLKALLDLQGILGSQKLPLDQIVLIRDQVKALSAASRPPEPAPAPQPVPVPATVPPPVTVEQPAVQQPTLASLLGGHNALAALLARASSNPPTSSLPQQNAQPGPPKSYTPPVYQPAAAALPVASAPPQVPNPASLLDQLRAAGLLQGGSGTPQPPQLPGLSAQPTYPPPLPLPPRQTAPTHPSQNISTSDIQLTAASLKM
jgi:pre-mRNA cleavage complex 2 protein Pcf11